MLATRPAAAAADEQDRSGLFNLALEFGNERGIWPVAGIGQYLDLHGAGNAADVIPFGAGAHVHQFRARNFAPERVGLCRCERAAVRQSHLPCALPCRFENLGYVHVCLWKESDILL